MVPVIPLAQPQQPPLLGIVGGMGPYAGLDLLRKILDQTRVSTDQEHLPVAMLSVPGAIGDRTRYLLGEGERNPGWDIARVVLDLERVGARVIGIPCSTAHAPQILDVVSDLLAKAGTSVRLVNMVCEVVRHIRLSHPGVSAVGVLATKGTYASRTYENALGKAGIGMVALPEELQKLVHTSIYSTSFGIKTHASPVETRARSNLLRAAEFLVGWGAQAIILGCTEVPLAIPERHVGDAVVVDPTLVLARAMIELVAPERLRDWGDRG